MSINLALWRHIPLSFWVWGGVAVLLCPPVLLFFLPIGQEQLERLSYVPLVVITSCLVEWSYNQHSKRGQWCATWTFVAVASLLGIITTQVSQMVPVYSGLANTTFFLATGFYLYACVRVHGTLDAK